MCSNKVPHSAIKASNTHTSYLQRLSSRWIIKWWVKYRLIITRLIMASTSMSTRRTKENTVKWWLLRTISSNSIITTIRINTTSSNSSNKCRLSNKTMTRMVEAVPSSAEIIICKTNREWYRRNHPNNISSNNSTWICSNSPSHSSKTWTRTTTSLKKSWSSMKKLSRRTSYKIWVVVEVKVALPSAFSTIKTIAKIKIIRTHRTPSKTFIRITIKICRVRLRRG